MKNKIALFLLLAMAVSQAAFAGECAAMNKLGRGVKGVLTSPIEISNEYRIARAADHNIAESTASGVFVGLFMTGKRIVNGAYDIVTFPLTCPRTGGLLFADDYPTALDEDRALSRASK